MELFYLEIQICASFCLETKNFEFYSGVSDLGYWGKMQCLSSENHHPTRGGGHARDHGQFQEIQRRIHGAVRRLQRVLKDVKKMVLLYKKCLGSDKV